MTAADCDRLVAAVAELANALQVAAPVAARIRERAETLAQDAGRLETAIERATEAVRQLQPGKGGTR